MLEEKFFIVFEYLPLVLWHSRFNKKTLCFVSLVTLDYHHMYTQNKQQQQKKNRHNLSNSSLKGFGEGVKKGYETNLNEHPTELAKIKVMCNGCKCRAAFLWEMLA